jgi:hypothetical protein
MGIIKHEPDHFHAMDGSTYNFKIPVRVETDKEIISEINSDSHLNLIAEWYFKRLQKISHIQFLNEKPTEFCGMGLNLSSDHSSLMLNIQLGRNAMKARFVVSKELQTSPIILGSVFLINPPSAAEIFFEFFLEIWICC